MRVIIPVGTSFTTGIINARPLSFTRALRRLRSVSWETQFNYIVVPGTVSASQRLRIFSNGGSNLSKALRGVGRIAKTLHLLHYIQDADYRRGILTQLNHTEHRHKLARRICYGNRGELKQGYREGQ